MNAKPVVKLSKKKKISNPLPNDAVEGYEWSMDVKNLPKKKTYTIFQSIDSTVYTKTGSKVYKDNHVFTEMWHKKKHGLNTDAFVVPRWWRSPTENHDAVGFLEVRSKLWVVEGNTTFKSVGATKGTTGKDPWGDAHAVKRVIKPPQKHPFIIRHFRMTWENKVGTTVAKLKNATDLKIVTDTERLVDPTMSPELYMDDPGE